MNVDQTFDNLEQDEIAVGLINSLTCLGLRSGPLALLGLAFSFAFWMN